MLQSRDRISLKRLDEKVVVILSAEATMSVGRAVSWGIVTFWAVMMMLLVRLEVLPALRTGPPASYRALVGSLEKPKTVRMGIYALGQRLGTTTSTTTPLPDGSVRIGNETDADLGVFTAGLGSLQPPTWLRARTDIWLSSDYRLRRFHIAVSSAVLSTRISGVVEGEELILTFGTNGHSRTSRVPFDPEMPLTDGLAPMVAAGGLRVGREWQINVLDPRDLSPTQALVRVVGQGSAMWRGQPVRTYRLRVTYEGRELEAVVTADGEVLRQTLNWSIPLTFVREEDRAPVGEGP